MIVRGPGDWMEMLAHARLDDPALSPCIGVCVMDAASGYCSGCLRTLGEIAAWSGASEATRRAIKAALPARRDLLVPGGSGSSAAGDSVGYSTGPGFGDNPGDHSGNHG